MLSTVSQHDNSWMLSANLDKKRQSMSVLILQLASTSHSIAIRVHLHLVGGASGEEARTLVSFTLPRS